MRPVQQAFKLAKAAVCLTNEWRDTLMATAGAVYLGIQVSNGNFGAMAWGAVALSSREFVRSLAWYCSKHRQLQVAGGSLKPIDTDKRSTAAGFVAALACSSSYFLSHNPLLGLMITPALTSYAYAHLRLNGAGLRDIPGLYFNPEDGMWDWPRKNKGNGPTQTEKLKDSFSKLKKMFSFGSRRWVSVPVPVDSGCRHAAQTVSMPQV